MNVAITLVAALLLGVGFVLQQKAAEQAPQALFLRLALIADLLRRRRWLAGLAVMIAGELASAWSVSHLSLSVAEPLLTTSLLFALALAVPLSGQRLRATELVGVVILSGGVAALSVGRSAHSPAESFASPAGWLAAAAIAGLAACFLQVGKRCSGQVRATFIGTAAGLVFGISDALTRQTVHVLNTHPFTSLLTDWPGYSLIGASLVGLWLMQSAFNSAPLHASLPAISAAEPAAGIILGVVVFGDEIQTAPIMIAVQIVGVVALVVGVVLVARAPALADLRPSHLVPPRLSGPHPIVRPRASRQEPSVDDQGQKEEAPDAASPVVTRTSSHGPSGA
jgi:drug/metabolite transporter (DMT)-like permease